MRVWGYKQIFRMKDAKKFFKDRNELIMETMNAVEMEKRLCWLAEGILHSNIYITTPIVVDKAEIEQWVDFVAWVDQQNRCQS